MHCKDVKNECVPSSGEIKRSVVEIQPMLRPIQTGDRLVMLGSCFAQYMGEKLQSEGFEVMVNPLGTLFNPFSIGQTVRTALNGASGVMPVFEVDDEWRCWWANTRFRANSRESLEQQLKADYQALGKSLSEAEHLVLTLGTNVCYTTPYPSVDDSEKVGEKADEIVVTNCQRQPDRLFTEWRATVGELVQCMACMVERLLKVNPSLQVIFTVSPYRYHKYGYHGSQLSKAALLLAEDEIIRRYPANCCYFPAYEILLDELRDYDFYAPDGHHPGPKAVDHIWCAFRQSFAPNS